MTRTLLVLATLAALPAWAVGEHISVTGPAKEQLSETLCISMECKAGNDFTVSSKLVGEQMELRVVGPDGTVRLTMKAATNGQGRMSSCDAMSATSQLVHAIETPFTPSKVVEAAPAKKAVKLSAKSKLAKRQLHAPIRVAARMRARG